MKRQSQIEDTMSVDRLVNNLITANKDLEARVRRLEEFPSQGVLPNWINSNRFFWTDDVTNDIWLFTVETIDGLPRGFWVKATSEVIESISEEELNRGGVL